MPAPARFLVFSDGSALVNPGGPGGTGFVVLDRSRPAVRFGGTRWVADGASPVTNNRMELRAVLEALDGLPAGEAVEVISDSRYVVDSLSKWIHGWRKKGWRTSTGGPVLNRDLDRGHRRPRPRAEDPLVLGPRPRRPLGQRDRRRPGPVGRPRPPGAGRAGGDGRAAPGRVPEGAGGGVSVTAA